MINKSLNRISEGYWIWGTFNIIETKKLEEIKKKINKKLKGPFFNIHITLSGPITKNIKEINRTFIKLKNKKTKIKLIKYDFKDKFYESFYIKVDKTKELINLKNSINYNFNLNKKKFNPHISLYYGIESLESKKKISKNLNNINMEMNISKISLIYVNEKKNIWKVIKTKNLI